MKNMLELASVWGTVAVLIAFTWGGLVGMGDPVASATKFGMPIKDEAGVFYFRVYRSRDFVLLLLTLIFLLRRDWASLAMLMTVCVALPIFDAALVYRQLGATARLVPHLASAGLLAALSTILWFQAIANAGADQ